MNLWINNTQSGEQWHQRLIEFEYSIGRPSGDNDTDQGPDIVLPSRLISRSHAVLRMNNNSWSLEHLGLNETTVGGQLLSAGERFPLRPEDEIRIGEFVLTLVEDDKQPIEVDSSDKFLAQYVALEQEIHSDLLERLDLRRNASTMDFDSPKTRDKINKQLNSLIDNAVQKLDDSVIDGILSIALYRRFSWLITAGRGDVNISFNKDRDIGDNAFETMLGDILKRIAGELEISFIPKQMEADLKLLGEQFSGVLGANRLEFSTGLRQYVVKNFIARNIHDLIFGFGPLQDLLDMDNISEIMVVSRDQIFVETFGVVEDTKRAFFTDEMLLSVIERIVAPVGRRIDKSTPMVDAHLPDGSRVNAVIPPLALKGPCLTIRKFSASALTIKQLVEWGVLSEAMEKFVRACVKSHKNLIVSGGTGSGKTTFLNCLSSYIDPKERIITVEDTAELQLMQNHVVTLESRPANMEGVGAITIRDLVKNALRMRPNRIVVGECRGGETIDMLQAMNTGHDGSMTTAHANSPEDMMLRLETMILSSMAMPVSAIRDQIVSAVDIVIQLTRFSDGARRVTQISEVVGIDESSGTIVLEDIFRYQLQRTDDSTGGAHSHTGYIPSFIEELLLKGVVSLDTFL